MSATAAPMSFDTILNRGRMLSDGVPFADVHAAEQVAAEGTDVHWFDFWMARADAYEELGDQAVAAGNTSRPASGCGTRALSATTRSSCGSTTPSAARRDSARKVELFDRAAPPLRPGRLSASSSRSRAPPSPATCACPRAADGPVPCCVLIGGLESTKEESYLFEAICLRRGMATFAFDGPGQGELFFTRQAGPRFRAVRLGRPRPPRGAPSIDSERHRRARPQPRRLLRPAVGRVRRAAARPASRGAPASTSSDLDTMPRAHAARLHLRHRHRGRASEALAHLRESIDLHRVADGLRCPTLRPARLPRRDLHHAPGRAPARDLTNADARDRSVEPDGDHCCHNMGPIVRPAHGGLDGPSCGVPRGEARRVRLRGPDVSGRGGRAARGQQQAKVLAGGQSLVPLLNLRLATPDLLVDLRRVPGLDAIARAGRRARRRRDRAPAPGRARTRSWPRPAP